MSDTLDVSRFQETLAVLQRIKGACTVKLKLASLQELLENLISIILRQLYSHQI